MIINKARTIIIICILIFPLMYLECMGDDIHDAVMAGNLQWVEELISKDPLVTNAVGDGGKTPIHYCAVFNQLEIARILISNAADVNARDDDYNTPLHLAAMWGNTGVAKILLENRAEVNPKNKDNKTPLKLAETRFQYDTAELLRKYGGQR